MTTQRAGRPGTRPRTPLAVRLSAAAVTGTVLLSGLLAGCSAGDGGTAESSEPAMARQQPVGEPEDGGVVSGFAGGRAATADGDTGSTVPGVTQEKEISTGTVALRSDDVADLRFDVQGIADDAGGQVAEESADTSRSGEMLRSRMVLRIPTAEFDATMDTLERAGRLVSSRRGSDVVTAEYRDVQARVRAQEKSLARVEILFGRARNIRDIMAIEAELSRRQADLDALKGQLRYLYDQTSMSTITVRLERTPEPEQKEPDEAGGFLAGFEAGWVALGGVALAVATLTGALLPFAVVMLLLGTPVWLLVRRRRTSPVVEPAPAE